MCELPPPIIYPNFRRGGKHERAWQRVCKVQRSAPRSHCNRRIRVDSDFNVYLTQLGTNIWF